MHDFIESIFIGALGTGVNKNTLILINIVLLAGIGLMSTVLLVETMPVDIQIHLAVLISLSLGLLLSFNWVVTGVGTATISEQKKGLKLG